MYRHVVGGEIYLEDTSCKIWYVDERELKNVATSKRPYCEYQNASDIFLKTKEYGDIIEGYLKHEHEGQYFSQINTTYTYFWDFRNRQKVYFTFNKIILYEVIEIFNEQYLRFILKRVNNPEKPKESFPPNNMIYVETMANSYIQQGLVNSNLTVNIVQENNKDLDWLIETVKEILPALDLTIEVQKELIAEVETLEIQKKSPNPKKIIRKESLKTIRNLLENIGGNLLTIKLIGIIDKLISN